MIDILSTCIGIFLALFLKTEHFNDGLFKDPVYVHLVPHSHDDVGWLKTVDQYFTGDEEKIQKANVTEILTNNIRALLENPERRFSYVEIKFFSMWWDNQTQEMQNDVKVLVSEGRLEFLNAGWSMHDEACTHYDDMMNNMMIG